MNVTEYTVSNVALVSWVWINKSQPLENQEKVPSPMQNSQPKPDILQPVRQWLNNLEISNPNLAHRLCQAIPAQCPFERDVKVLGRTLFHIPPMCKLNPLYEEVVGLRFRALCYLADTCGEDITRYC
ncbi:Mo-dependent nitrogenase C-terminal domain-containing protein [Merismopedia glauca]|uniref:Nitrogenase n=1 Tax=Merismopedia glauca CCAP 1448/3 TaxID=1296344 RepID=A0A2T1C0X9_9CYAN|nr:Mo-dependent nitrogenase C-terminal domain-containing protein [Merismopedia glauca]PSB01783.1 nitrogenase [Merismopedia glauca CCAP 1448/3]